MLYLAERGGDGTLPTEALGIGIVMDNRAAAEVEIAGGRY
jgi:hypothetical protein